jgi:hypothetical protein
LAEGYDADILGNGNHNPGIGIATIAHHLKQDVGKIYDGSRGMGVVGGTWGLPENYGLVCCDRSQSMLK